MRIEPERPEDREAVATLIARAFGRADEALLVEALRQEGAITLSLVARDDTGIVGHIAFQPVSVEGAPEAISAASLAPVSVLPGRQKAGVGSALIRAGIEAMREIGRDIIFVLGDPAYYERFGFTAKAAQAYETPWPGPHFMALDITGRRRGGRLIYPRAFFDGVA